MRKRAVALLLATMLVWSLSAPAWAAVNPFSDLRSDHWAYDSVVTLAAAGLVEGYPDGTFGGDRNFTRYEMAMVFARILARFESIIDAKVKEGVDVQTADLEAKIAATRDELTALVIERYDELAARFEEMNAQLDEHRDNHPQGTQETLPTSGANLSDEARAALEDAVVERLNARLEQFASQRDVDELARRIVGVEGGLSDLERRMLQIEGSTPTRAEAQLIAERAIADALAERDEEIKAALAAAEGDTAGLSELIDGRVDDLAAQIDALAVEFRSELDALGVRVDQLESQVAAQAQLIDDQGRRIDSVEEQMDSVRLFGSAELLFRQTTREGSAPFYKDPRDDESGQYRESGNEFENRLTLGVEAEPAENVDLRAELVFKDLFFNKDQDDQDGSDPGINVDLVTPGVLRSLHAGEMDLVAQSQSFNKYTLHSQVFEDETVENEVQGVDVNLVYGLNDSTSVDAFLIRRDDADYVAGAAAGYTLADSFDLTFRAVRQTTSPDAANGNPPPALTSNTTYSVESKGNIADLTYQAEYAANSANNAGVRTAGNAIDAVAELPIVFTTAQLEYASVDANFAPLYGKQLNSGQGINGKDQLPSSGDDWLERKLAPPEDKVRQGQTEYKGALLTPLFGADTTVAMGQRQDGAGTNDYTQFEVSGVQFAGVDVAVLYDERSNQLGEEDNTRRATLGTTLLGTEVSATIHNRTNAQSTWANGNAQGMPEPTQRGTWVSATRDFELGLPVNAEAHYGVNQVLNRAATRLGLGTELPLSNHLSVRAGYQTEQNAVGSLDDKLELTWWKNSEWTTNQRDSAVVGVDYVLRDVFGTDVTTGYEHRVVRVNNAVYGAPRNTVSASFEKSLRGGEATLAGGAKYVTGGNPDEDKVGNDRDLVANLKLTYPVFDGANLILGGEWVRSEGNRLPASNEYNVFRLDAGVKVEF